MECGRARYRGRRRRAAPGDRALLAPACGDPRAHGRSRRELGAGGPGGDPRDPSAQGVRRPGGPAASAVESPCCRTRPRPLAGAARLRAIPLPLDRRRPCRVACASARRIGRIDARAVELHASRRRAGVRRRRAGRGPRPSDRATRGTSSWLGRRSSNSKRLRASRSTRRGISSRPNANCSTARTRGARTSVGVAHLGCRRSSPRLAAGTERRATRARRRADAQRRRRPSRTCRRRHRQDVRPRGCGGGVADAAGSRCSAVGCRRERHASCATRPGSTRRRSRASGMRSTTASRSRRERC